MHSYRIIIGIGYDANGNAIAPAQQRPTIQRILRNAARQFGGFTLTHTQGGWIDDAGRLVTEPGVTIDIVVDKRCGAFANSEDGDPATEVGQFAKRAGGMLGQQSVVVQYPNGTADILTCG